MLFGKLDLDAASPLLATIQQASSEPDTALYRQGEEASTVYSVTRGVVMLSLLSPSGDSRIVRILGRGATIGLEGLVGQPYQNSAIALTEVSVCKIPRQTLSQLTEQQNILFERLMQEWQSQLFAADAHLLDLSTGQVKDRVVHLISMISRICRDSDIAFRLPTVTDMAALVAARPESVSREVAGLKRAGLLEKGPQGNWMPTAVLTRML